MIFNFISDRRPLCSESEIARRTRCNFGHLSTVVIPTVKGIAELLQIFKSNGFTLDSIRRYVIVGCTFSILVGNGIRDRLPLCSEGKVARRTYCNVGHLSTVVIPTVKGIAKFLQIFKSNGCALNGIRCYIVVSRTFSILIGNGIRDRLPLCSEREITRRTRCNFGHFGLVLIPTIKGIAEFFQIFKSNGCPLNGIRCYIVVSCIFGILIGNGICGNFVFCIQSDCTH